MNTHIEIHWIGATAVLHSSLNHCTIIVSSDVSRLFSVSQLSNELPFLCPRLSLVLSFLLFSKRPEELKRRTKEKTILWNIFCLYLTFVFRTRLLNMDGRENVKNAKFSTLLFLKGRGKRGRRTKMKPKQTLIPAEEEEKKKKWQTEIFLSYGLIGVDRYEWFVGLLAHNSRSIQIKSHYKNHCMRIIIKYYQPYQED